MKTFQQFREDITPEENPLNDANKNAEYRQRRQKVKQYKAARRHTSTNMEEVEVEEVYDPEIQGRSQIKQTGEGGRKEPKRDTASRRRPGVKPRVKAIGGGKTAPVGEYKDRKDIGSTKARSEREQQPTKERGSAADAQKAAAKAERKKAALARIAARKSGGEVKKDTTSSKDAEKKATSLLKKKETKKVNPNYKPREASGYTRQERMKITRAGERELKGIMKKQETDRYKKETGQNPDAKGRTKILGRVHKRMSEETVSEAQAITNTTQGGSSGTRDDMEVKKKQPSLLKKLQGKRDAKKATNNVAKAAGQSVKNATDNTAGTGSQRKPQPYRQANKTATKGGEITKVGDNKTSAVVKKPASQEIQKVRVKVMQKVQGRPMLGSAQRPDLAGAKPQPQIAGVPAQKQLSANPVRKALPAAKS